jgi:ABC-type branched-subunit amino acid transport system substrate-binding protein
MEPKIVNTRFWIAFATALVLAVSAGHVRAHGFNVGFLAPLSGPNSLQGRQAVDGFLLATRERDGHALEESDGHLGGLDSYLITIDSGADIDIVRGQLEALLGGEGIAFLSGVSVSETIAAIGITLDQSQVILVDAVDSAVYRSATSDPADLLTMDGIPFPVAFRNAYGYEPGAGAIGGYLAARFIDAAVSAAEGEFSRRDSLNRALDRAREHLP